MSVYANEKPEHYKKCLESLCHQTLKANEIIVVHDGPVSSELIEIENSYQDQLNIKIVSLQKNQGLGVALNEGLKHCSYELVARMDSDDICLPDRFSKQIEFIKKNSNVDIISGVISEFNLSPQDGCVKRKLPLIHPKIVKFCKYRSPFNHVAVMYKKEKVLQAGGYQHLLYMEDYYLWVRMILSGAQCANLPDNLVYVRAGPSMIARRGGLQYVKSMYFLLKYMRQHHFISYLEMISLLSLRFVVSFLPVWVRKYVYRFLRSY